MGKLLQKLGWKTFVPQGSYFAIVHIPGIDDVEYSEMLTKEAKVACIPISVFCKHSTKEYLRFSFCKDKKTLDSALERLEAFLRRS